MLSPHRYSPRMDQLQQTMQRLDRWFANPKNAQKTLESCDFLFGNAHDMPLPGFVKALQTWSEPRSPDWYAYNSGEDRAREVIATALTARFGRPYVPEDIVMTNGAIGALTVLLDALVGPGDEVIFNLPPWFFYIEAAITPKTRAIIVNSPNNPTGKIYPPATLQALADILAAASQRHNRVIYLISDESYRQIIFDDRIYPSPTAYYASSIMVYTYGKTLLTPGERLGYLALSPEMAHREALRDPIGISQVFTGYAVASSLLLHGIADLEQLSIDIKQLERRRNRLVDALRGLGYGIHASEGTFYLLPRSPGADDWASCELLVDHDIFCLPGSVVEIPGHFRMSITASDHMIDRAISGFGAAMDKAQKTTR